VRHVDSPRDNNRKENVFLKEEAKTSALGVWVLEAAIAGFGIWMVAPLPVAYAGGGADDLLFVRLANFILDGRWLGPFDQYTLIKGPFYPLFLAAAAATRVPIQIATQAVVLLGALIASRVAGRLLGSRAAGCFCFALIALNPAPLGLVATLLYREPLYAGLLLLTLGTAARLALLPRALWWALPLGLAFAAFWLTREEGLLLIPSLALLAAWRVGHDVAHRTPMPATLARLLLPVAAGLAPILLVAEINRIDYGVFRTSDYKAPPVLAAYSALSRIRHDTWIATVPVPRDAFARAYEVSPAARLLAANLEGPGRAFWANVSCRDEPFAGCDDIEAGWIMWALRGAATAAGQYGSAKQADRFFRRIAVEVNAACDSGQIPCSARRLSLLPPIRAEWLPAIGTDILDVAWDTMRLGPTTLGAVATQVPPSAYGPYRRITPGALQSPPAGPAQAQAPGLPPPQRAIAGVLVRVLPPITCAALPAALLWTMFLVARDIASRRIRPLTAFLAAIAGAVVLRIVFLGVMKATLFPMQFRYESPVFPLVLLMAGMVLAQAVIVLSTPARAFLQRHARLPTDPRWHKGSPPSESRDA
jgi:hypothetical protein